MEVYPTTNAYYVKSYIVNRVVQLMVFAADKPADVVLLSDKNIVPS
jgi:hypothetical protein